MSNKVLAGSYEGSKVSGSLGTVAIQNGFNMIYLDKSTVEDYEVITEEHRKSASSGVARGLVGGAILGPVGLLAGGMSAKNKGTYQLAVQFKNGERSLIEVNNKIYKTLINKLF